ncbi:Hypothetical protein PHPALM_1824 [Phytophthora palmivora]|uniref:DDE-1 domain-containing protein n=1 Tax=Phytophthora palmivora TaxID=4796 RepID=A0A2P4YRB7_9STRA|nr:Hypothetical protein PHPALM_1824 [Phytophthora palmivora]
MRRDDFPLKTSHVVVFIKEEYEDLAEAYLAKNKEESLGPMIRRFIYQHGFSFRRPTKSVLSTQDLEAEQLKFANEVGAKYSTPTRIISERGSKKAVKVKGRTRWERASVLLVVSATGKKLRPLIIFKGQPDGRVEGEVRNISSKVVTAVQKNAWVDSLGWYDAFIEGLWASFVSDTVPGPLALYLDNLKCHVLTESQVALAAWGTETVPLPKNTTSVLQSLDVGVMGPFKQKLRALTLSYELGALRASDNMSLRERLLKLQCLSAPDKRRRLVERVAAAWDSVSEKSIKKAWQKAGL